MTWERGRSCSASTVPMATTCCTSGWCERRATAWWSQLSRARPQGLVHVGVRGQVGQAPEGVHRLGLWAWDVRRSMAATVAAQPMGKAV